MKKIALFLLISLCWPSAQANQTLFSAISGNWRGIGFATVNGSNQRVQCRAWITQQGTGLRYKVTCASVDFKISFTANISANGNNLGGSWTDTYYQTHGRLAGSANAQNLNVRLSSKDISGRVQVTSINRQFQDITASIGQGDFSIRLRK